MTAAHQARWQPREGECHYREGSATSRSRSAMPAAEEALGQGLPWDLALPRHPH